ncbi:hypothetical protein G6F21_014242 [Rhizopus arrhizus]|nr:hypothetical protein G6F21_014242 [Rhizopus arrhizus]
MPAVAWTGRPASSCSAVKAIWCAPRTAPRSRWTAATASPARARATACGPCRWTCATGRSIWPEASQGADPFPQENGSDPIKPGAVEHGSTLQKPC